MSHHLFVYGTLMFPEVYRAVSGRARSTEEATLSGHRRYAVKYIDGAVFPAIVTEIGGQVRGKLIREVSDEEFAIIDLFEEVDGGLYRKAIVSVETAKGKVQALTYLAGDRLAGNLSGEWDPEKFQLDQLANYLAGPVAEFRKDLPA